LIGKGQDERAALARIGAAVAIPGRIFDRERAHHQVRACHPGDV
jgi:hypothetical protein